MALPNYDHSDSFAAGGMTRRQVQRDRRQERRQRKKIRKISTPSEGGGSTEWGTIEPPPTPVDEDWGYIEPLTNQPGYQGQYVAPDNSAQHPFYSPGASYARPGDQHFQLAQGSPLQQVAFENNPGGAYYGWANNQGYGGFDAESQTVQGMYKDFATGYEAAKLYNNFQGNWRDFMDMQDVPHLLEQMTDAQLGIDRSQFRGRDRWALRGI
jgi:hypothetical protein